MGFDQLTIRAEQATRRAEQAYHDLLGQHDDTLEFERTSRVSRYRFATLVDRIRRNGTPYGAHTIPYRPSGKLLLVRHEGVNRWVVPGGSIDTGESYVEAARRELGEEAGIEVEYDGLAFLIRIQLRTPGYETWGLLPVFAAQAVTTEPEITDPDEEISAAEWFEALPADTRDREQLLIWRDQALE